jgi:HEAT repeat protein
MPFKPDLEEVYMTVIRPTVERDCIACVRADDIYGPNPIMADIWRSIRKSILVVADLTGRNPNVFYELGLAHSIQKPVILLAQDIQDVPFDLKHLRVITYDNSARGRKRLETKLRRTLDTVVGQIDGRKSSEPYAVLEEQERAPRQGSKAVDRLLRNLRSNSPRQVLVGLSKTKDIFGREGESKECDPRITSQLINLLESAMPEVQAAAIKALAKAGSQVHCVYLYSFLSSDNPFLSVTACEALGDLRDEMALPRFIVMYDDPKYCTCRPAILHAMGSIGGEECAHFLSKVASNPDTPKELRHLAIHSLGKANEDCALKELVQLDISTLDPEGRSEVGEAIANSASPYLPSLRKKVQNQIEQLLSDKQSEVRGQALAAWLSHSKESHDLGWLDRSFFWNQLSKASQVVLATCFLSISMLFDNPFTEEETPHIVRIAKKNPELLSEFVGYLRDIGDASACDLMLRSYNECKDDRIWVLDYFSRVPCKQAEDVLRHAFAHSSEVSCACLAAIGLLKLGTQDTTDYLLQHALETYGWVQVKVRDCLAQQLEKEESRPGRKKIQQMLKRLPSAW